MIKERINRKYGKNKEKISMPQKIWRQKEEKAKKKIRKRTKGKRRNNEKRKEDAEERTYAVRKGSLLKHGENIEESRERDRYFDLIKERTRSK